MKQLRIDDWLDVRIWRNDVPAHLALHSTAMNQRTIPNSTRGKPNVVCALEVCRVLGPRSSYGLLGCTFSATQDSELVIQVPTDCKLRVPYNSALVDGDDVYVGIPEWGISALVDTIATYDGAINLGSGILSIDYGAYGTMSSNLGIFKIISKLLVDLIVADPTPVKDTDFVELINTHFGSISKP